MGLFSDIEKQKTASLEQRNPQQAFQQDLSQLKSDPVAYAKAHGKNIPEGMTDPSQMIQYLLNSTQVNNPRYQLAMQMINRLAGKR